MRTPGVKRRFTIRGRNGRDFVWLLPEGPGGSRYGSGWPGRESANRRGAMNVARYLIRFIHAQRIDTLFGIPGALNSTLYDELQAETNPGVRHVLARHELGAGSSCNGRFRSQPAAEQESGEDWVNG